MEMLICAWQFGHPTPSVCDGDICASASQALHLKCIMGTMRAFLVILFAAVSVQAQSLADLARHERERQAHLKPAQVITGNGSASSVQPGTPAPSGTSASSVTPGPKTEEAKKPPVDPVKEYNEQVENLRAKIRSLQDEETATQLQINELNGQVYAAVVDPAEKDQALAAVGAVQMKLADIRRELADTRKTLEALETQGPPKAAK